MTEVVPNDAGQAVDGSGAAGQAATASGASRGATVVSEEVVEKIAGTAARSVPGVADLGGDVARFFNSVLDRVGLDEVGDASRGISAEVKGTSAVIKVVLVIEAGHVVGDVTEAVRAKVIEAVENYGLRVTEVNVKVDDIELNPPAAAGA
ncbi:Asp23/Gls24 family envelope stress response protein [Plantactinospora sp. CA-290183]|uniref:Asp23/Gls24 family envelope stress response protein n=1 Tax=Plantactinospora sp. CA-290183 TaxID=3240006 RepID=UPI003D8B40F5